MSKGKGNGEGWREAQAKNYLTRRVAKVCLDGMQDFLSGSSTPEELTTHSELEGIKIWKQLLQQPFARSLSQEAQQRLLSFMLIDLSERIKKREDFEAYTERLKKMSQYGAASPSLN